ncbi:hypothetical protein ACT3UJ_01170 [Halomonas sp. 86]|uniref:hypothetical protein n=1 Tax=Halomonas TaxID=2745 RepID=UPI0015535F82|nr:hypothetical protein [Halomonas hibernica]
MRDLYQRLNVPPQANDEELQQAVARCPNSALRQDAEAAFAVAKRRADYDKLHATLSDIGQLRTQLGLTHGAHWQDDVANDFSVPPDEIVSRHDKLVDRVSHVVKLYNRWRGLRGAWLLIAIFTIGTGLGIALGLTLSQTIAA